MNIGSSKKLNTKKDNDAKSVKPAKFKRKKKKRKKIDQWRKNQRNQ